MTSVHENFLGRLGLPALPPASALMGSEVVEFDQGQGRIVVRYRPDPAFRNLVGTVHGGFLAALLDECMGFAGVVASDFTRLCPTVEIKTSFLRPAPMGVLIGEGRTLRLGRSIAFLEGALTTQEGIAVATGSATATPIAIPNDWAEVIGG